MAALAKYDENMQQTPKVFPAEAYHYTDDVTTEGVAQVRARAQNDIESEEWEVIDGIGDITAS